MRGRATSWRQKAERRTANNAAQDLGKVLNAYRPPGPTRRSKALVRHWVDPRVPADVLGVVPRIFG